MPCACAAFAAAIANNNANFFIVKDKEIPAKELDGSISGEII